MLFFETLLDRVYQQWEDVADDYGLSNHHEAKIFDDKMALLLSVRGGGQYIVV